VGFAHRRLQIERLDVLPMLLQQRNKEVNGQHDIGNQLVFSHFYVTNSNTQTEHLLKLELDGSTDLIGLISQGVTVRDGGRELTNLVETRTQETGNLLDQSLRGKESIVLFGELLDELLVLVELLEIVNRLELHTSTLSLVTVESIAKDTNSHTGTGNVGELDGTRETLITLGIIVLQTNLKFNGFDKLTGLGLAVFLDFDNDVSNGGSADFATSEK
jgi:hypothetical protein